MALPPPAPTSQPTDRLLPLLAIVPILLVILFVAAPPRFADPDIHDEIIVVYPVQGRMTTDTLTLLGDWNVSDRGATPAQPGASLKVTPPGGPWQRVHLTINGDVSGEWGVRLARDFHRNTFLGIKPGVGRIFEGEQLPGAPIGWDPIDVEIFPTGEGTHLVNRVVVRLVAETEFLEPALPGIVVGAFLPLLLAAFFRYAGRRTSRQAVLTGGIFGSVAVLLSAWSPDTIPYVWAAGTAFALGAASGALFKMIQARKAGDEARAGEMYIAFQALALAGILAFALQARWEVLKDQWSIPLSPDAIGYLEIAFYGTFYETLQTQAPWIREPLFPAWLRLWFSFAPETMTSARVSGIPIALAVVTLLFFVGRKLFNPWVGLLAAAVYAVNGFAAIESIRVLRDDLLVAFLLALACCPLYLREDRWGRAIAWGLLGAGLGLLRINALFLAIAFGGWEAWRRRWHPGEIILALGLALVPVIPHLVYNARVSGGDWMYSSNVHTMYYYNNLMIGREGFPKTTGEWEADPYVGEVIGSGILLREPSVPVAFARTMKGFTRVFLKDFPHYRLLNGSWLLMIFGVVGFWVLLNRREVWWFYIWSVLFMAPVAIIAAIRFDHRLALPAAPAILFAWAAGVWQVAIWLRILVGRIKGKETPEATEGE